ncbi:MULTISPECIES: sensor histidine kinase [Olivibacter]|jgi:nitrogen fixation/metabolism regulation signal transduction histidine kinase|uniref:histidine kinase n=1 Tax=Olivibacter oleidegradans TaxID=760123 RepID=A0ABV6HEZ5_9SPHI|nr:MULTISPECIES: ATP-binding protein [Olivibacter]MDX3912031.1 ATP-binding protein [Pseudosphingobacterium sp.]QEK99769.1 GHKL domain-containing protein [Olivibacter sp. LS-1]
MNRLRLLITFRAFLLFLIIGLLCWLLLTGYYLYALLVLPVSLWMLSLNFRSQLRAYRELEEFAEAARYRDFTRFFPLQNAGPEIRPLRGAFNEINGVFKKISSERETQYQYLQTILEVVNTAILSYDERTGKVVWMNEAFKELFNIPYISVIEGLNKRNPDLYRKVTEVSSDKADVFTVPTPKGVLKLQFSTSSFQTPEGHYRLLAFQNINEALDETESRAWQKLLSVLTHEIMNSIAPISSLADTLKNRLETLPNSEELDDIRLGTETIKRRSEGLLKFASTYRSLNKIAQPELTTVYASDLFENLYQLMEPSLIQKNIELDIILKDPILQLSLDVNLIEQVLINLLLNAMEAVKDIEKPYISLSALANNGSPQIKVMDNGKGIPKDLLESIFVPFFTTRKSGSGVGLTLSKQIMLMHKGNISVHSEEGKGSVFTLQF